MGKLKVAEARYEDVFEDIARINFRYRVDAVGRRISSGSVCNIAVAGRSALAIVRGLPESEGALIRLDEALRDRLGLKLGSDVEVSLEAVGFLREWRWGWDASAPSYRIASRVAVVSLILGFIGLILGFISLCVSIL